jgi:signal transduction histidine kinase
MKKFSFISYILLFMVIIALSYAFLVTIISNHTADITDYLVESNIANALDSACFFVEHNIKADDLPRFLSENKPRLSLLYRNVSLFISDTNGNIIYGEEFDGAGMKLPDGLAAALLSGNVLPPHALDEFFSSPQMLMSRILFTDDGKPAGILFASTPKQLLDDVTSSYVRVLINSCFWLLLALLLAVYFVSIRILRPIRQMSKAAKNFAAGIYDTRVTVVGKGEVAELSEAFNNMADAMTRQEELRRMFLSNVSHDLRTPMTTISGFIDGILDGAISPEREQHYLAIIADETRRLSRLVNELLDISRMQAGERQFTLAPFDICEMARRIVLSFETKINDKNLNVEFDFKNEKIMAYADADAIYQILYNLCENAVKFSRDGGLYRIRIYEAGKRIHVLVYNEGIGISKENLPFVFDRFYKVDKSRSLDKSGVGLGLFIAKSIIDAHGEKIVARSEEGKYCEFEFTLRLPPRRSPARISQS